MLTLTVTREQTANLEAIYREREPDLYPSTPERVSRNDVVARLRADESNGYAIARFRLSRGQSAWNPAGTRSDRADLVGPASVVYERQHGRVTARYA